MKVSELRAGLNDLQRMLHSLGADKQATELKNAIEALAELDDLKVPELTNLFRSANTKKAASAPKPTNMVAVDEFLNKLKFEALTAGRFDRIVEDIKADKRLGKAELSELSRRFGGSEPDKLTKPAVIKFLRERRLEMQRQGGLGATIDKMLGRGSG